ncbi:unnamed protein product [Linum trigynum]|uniref:RNase H type-1 domain-containing protein n=1 Tax=Linum trigynum TaxID=586398 RepID=A0AAV2CX73_9ROSI
MLELPPKVHIFVWRWGSSILPTGVNLSRRIKEAFDECPFCGLLETQEHITRECDWAGRVWRPSNLAKNFQTGERKSCETWLCDLLEETNKEELTKVLITLWFLWKERNNHFFNNPKLEEWEIVGRAHNYLEEYAEHQAKGNPGIPAPRARSRVSWEPPPVGVLKLNTDAAILGEKGTGYGMVLRDWNGNFIMGATHRTRVRWPVELAEAKAMLWGLQLARTHQTQSMLLESDCQTLIQKLNRRETTDMEVAMICDEIREAAEENDIFGWRFWKREGNECAHVMARLRGRAEETEVWIDRPPVCLVTLLSKESDVVTEL